MVAQDRPIAGKIERPAFHDHFGLPAAGARAADRPAGPDKSAADGCERRELGAADAEEYPSRGRAQRLRRRGEIIDLDPAIADRSCQGARSSANNGTPACRASRDRMRAHFRGKGMGGIDHARDPLGAQIVDQAIDAAKATDAPGLGGRWGFRCGRHTTGSDRRR